MTTQFLAGSAADPTAVEATQRVSLARLAHEIRNPLAPIRMALQIMQVAEDDVATSRAARVIIDRQLDQLTRLIENLEDIAHLEDGSLKLRSDSSTVRAVVDRALQLARPQLESRQNALKVEVPADPLPVSLDIERVGQALANVLVNASKYSELGGAISLTAHCTREELQFRITDQGLGIPPEMLKRIFDPFVQVNRHGTGTHDGLGIGLAIVKNVVHAHGGTVLAESAGDNRGSTFTLTLPRGRILAPVPQAAETPTFRADHKLRILVADDNRDAAQTLAIMLTMEGHEVRTAYDGLEVLAAGHIFQPEVILLDIGMPVMDGYQTAKHIREREWGRHVYLVALTGWGQETDRQAALAKGFQGYLVKPASGDKIAAVLEDARRAQKATG